MTLPYDVTRCEGKGCGIRDMCKRHVELKLALARDNAAYLTVARSLCDVDESDERKYFIPAEEIL